MNNKEELLAIDIANMALEKLGEKPIDGFNPVGNPAERLCYMHYHPTRREVLCATAWDFATKTVTLENRTERTENGETVYRFRIPPDSLRVLECDCGDGWVLRGRNIVTTNDVKTVTIKHIVDEEEVSVFSDTFIEAFATRLASRLCIPLTASQSKKQKLSF